MTIIDVFNTLCGLNFSIYCIMHVLHSTFSHFHFPQAFFEQSVFFINVLFNHIISTEGPLSLKHTSFIGVVETCTNLTV